MENKNKNKVLENKIGKEIISALIPFFSILVIELIFKIGNAGILYVFACESKSIYFSILISYLIYGILIGINKKLSISTIIFTIIGTLLLAINQIKMIYTGEPIYFSDINFITNVKNIFNLVQGNLIISVKNYIYAFIILICLFYFIIIWVKNNDVEIRSAKVRCFLIISCIIVLVILFIPSKYTKDIFLNMFLNNSEHKDYNSYTTNVSYYYSHTLLSGMYGVLLNNRFDEPENYNEKNLNNILELVNEEEIQSDFGTPNIIVLFSESFWDVDKQEDVKFDIEVARNVKKLSKEGKIIETLTCAYGGMSENVAFEILTGGSLNYFTKGYIPIMSLYKRENSENIPSIVKELKNNNYMSKIIFGKDYYNSEKSMKTLGFDEYEELEDTKNNIKGYYISEEYITDKIIKELENKNKEKNIFLMAETIQNHMPYNFEKYEEYDISIKESTLSENMNNIMLSYSQGIFDADKELNRLYEYIKQYEEPTILIFLGDHLPYLYTEEGNNLLENLSYFNTEEELEKIYRKYNTQTLILSNYDVNLNKMPNYLSDDMILTYIVNNMDIDLTSYYKWLYSTIKELPASNSYISVDEQGNIYNNQELPERMERIYKLKEHMQYKFFVNPTE